MSSNKFDFLKNKKYINIETFRKSGVGVKTPVWFVIFNQTIYVATSESSGKIKRLKNNKTVRIVPSSFNGTPKGVWQEGQAFFASEDEMHTVMAERRKKYGLLGRIVEKFVTRKGKVVAIGIRI